MTYTLKSSDEIQLTIHADQRYSRDGLIVNTGERYLFQVDKNDRWIDLFIPSSANGFTNPLAMISGIRIKGVKCFCLCGCLNEDDTSAFPIGTSAEITMKQSGNLSFFPNDSWDYYKYNFGFVNLKIKRIS
jgi:hypothetical protein